MIYVRSLGVFGVFGVFGYFVGLRNAHFRHLLSSKHLVYNMIYTRSLWCLWCLWLFCGITYLFI